MTNQAATKPLTLKGFNGTITFDGAAITITRSGWGASAQLGKGVKRIPVNQITSVKYRPAGVFANGFIRFTIAGAVEHPGQGYGHQGADVARDENAVTYVGRQNDAAFTNLRDAIEAAMVTPVPAAPTGTDTEPAAVDAVSQLERLAVLRDKGALTPAEFDAAKARLLAML